MRDFFIFASVAVTLISAGCAFEPASVQQERVCQILCVTRGGAASPPLVLEDGTLLCDCTFELRAKDQHCDGAEAL